jgi:hypothetical protein
MDLHQEGLTQTYNRFHNPCETSADIMRLRTLHNAMDRAMLDAYDWTDINLTCEFLLDYEDEDEEEDGHARPRRKPWRYRWPDELRDEVLARLLKLNAERAEEERRAGAAGACGNTSKSNPSKKPTRRGRKPSAAQQPLPNVEPE